MISKTLIVISVAALNLGAPATAKAQAHKSAGVNLSNIVWKGKVKVQEARNVKVRVPTHWYGATATAYSTEGCDSSGGGSGTAMGTTARFGEVANNYLPLGTNVYFPKAIYGRHYFRVEDRIGWGSSLDIWLHCGSQMSHWNNPNVKFYTYRWKTKRKLVWVWKKLGILASSKPLIEGSKALFYRNQAYAPMAAPDKVKQVIWAGNEIHSTPYVWGGGHGAWLSGGYDCSGSVSYALHGAKLVSTTLVSGDYGSWGKEGTGKWITVYSNGGHVYMTVAGLRFDTSGANPSRWQNLRSSNNGYTVTHPVTL